MGILVGCEDVSHEWPGKQVLSHQTFSVNDGDRIGIVGLNGDGKSTLIEVIAMHLEPDSGTVTWRNNLAVGLLAQADELDDGDSVRHAVVGDLPEYEWAADARIRSILDALLGDVNWDGPVSELSGGQRRRADLARLLVGSWDVLCLDEPTNHLDVRAITWLAGHLRSRMSQDGALLVVTHDRWFLDEVCDQMWEVHDGRIDPFEGGYSAYVQQRVERERQAAVAELKRQNILRRELNWLAHGAKARTSKPKFRIAEAMALLADDPPLRNPVELKRVAVSRLGKQVIEMEDVSVSYDGNPVIEDVTWIIGPGDRVGILGENGAGKSTLLRVMCGMQKPSRGTVKIGKSVRFGFLSQHLSRLGERDDWRVGELLARYKTTYLVGDKQQTPEQLLERLGFNRRETMTFIGSLSGGQKRRLALMCVLLEEPNVLILDEPGNDLDTEMLAVLEDLLDTWPGTLVVVSHDRYLMERVTDNQYAIVGTRVRHCPGGVDEFLRMLAERDEAAAEASPKPKAVSAKVDAAGSAQDSPQAQSGMTNAQRRDAKRRFEAVTRRLERLSGEPDLLRKKMAEVDPSDFEALMAAQAKVDEALALIDSLEEEWLELSELLGEG